MSEAAVVPAPGADPRQRKLLRVAAWIVGTLLVLVLAHLAGIDVWGWFSQLWDTLTEISIGYIVLGCLFQGAQTMLTALGWYGILRYAYPGGVDAASLTAQYTPSSSRRSAAGICFGGTSAMPRSSSSRRDSHSWLSVTATAPMKAGPCPLSIMSLS